MAWWLSSAIVRETFAQLCLVVLEAVSGGVTSVRRRDNTTGEAVNGAKCLRTFDAWGFYSKQRARGGTWSTHQSSHGQNILDASYDESSVLFAQKSLQFNSAFLSKIKALLHYMLLLWNMWLKALLTCSMIFFNIFFKYNFRRRKVERVTNHVWDVTAPLMDADAKSFAHVFHKVPLEKKKKKEKRIK